MKIFGLYDKVSNNFVSTTLAENDGVFVRQAFYAIMMDYALNDVDYYCLGEVDTATGVIIPCRPRLCSWDAHKFPVSRVDKEHFLTKEEIIDSALKKKEEHIKEIKSKEYLEKYKELCVSRISELKKDKTSYSYRYLKHYENMLKEINKGLKDLEKKGA